MEITGLEVYKGDTYRVELDGEQTIFVGCSVVTDYCLAKGMTLDKDAVEAITRSDLIRKAKKRALYLLGYREYCSAELYKKLRQTYDEDIAKAAVDAMLDYGYINDEDYARKLAQHLIHTKHRGLRKAKYEMLSKGLDENSVEDALSEYSDEDIYEEITDLLTRKYYAKISDPDDRRRTIAALARRGYDYEDVKRCIEQILEEDEDFQ